MSNNFISKVKSAIDEYNMLQFGDTVVVALSGGADSVALLLAMLTVKDDFNLNVSAIHINHLLRGEESDADEKFCIDLCNRKNVPIISERHNVAEYAKKTKQSLEEAARDIRYKAFAEHSKGVKLATAHTAQDNAETFILNMTRGTGLRGLTGIPPVRDNIIRPMIYTQRADIYAFLSENNQDYVIDKTNLTNDYSRNKVRNIVIPVLKEINTSLFATVSSDIRALRLENSFISEQSSIAFDKCFITEDNALEGLSDYHKAIRHRCIVKYLSDNNLSYSSKRIEAIDKLIFDGGKINLSGNVYIVANKGILSIMKAPPRDTVLESITERPLVLGENIISPYKILKAELIKNSIAYVKKPFNISTNTYYMDYNKIIGKPILRGRNNGERITLFGNDFSSSVKKLINEKIPPHIRPLLCFVSDDKGLLLMEGVPLADRVKPDADSETILKISINYFD